MNNPLEPLAAIFSESSWVTILGFIITFLGGLYTARLTVKQQKKELSEQVKDNITLRWKELADSNETRYEKAESKSREIEERLNLLTLENREIHLAIYELRDDRRLSFLHNKDWWTWYDNGQMPPPPDRPQDLVEKVEQLIDAERRKYYGDDSTVKKE